MNEEFINPMSSLPVQVPLPAPGRTRNTLAVEDEREVFLRAWKQARPLHTGELAPAPMKAAPRSQMPRRARSHRLPVRDRCLRRTALADLSAGERRFFFIIPRMTVVR